MNAEKKVRDSLEERQKYIHDYDQAMAGIPKELKPTILDDGKFQELEKRMQENKGNWCTIVTAICLIDLCAQNFTRATYTFAIFHDRCSTKSRYLVIIDLIQPLGEQSIICNVFFSLENMKF